MKIKSITFKDHPILGDLNLKFYDENGSIYNTIIFAGENGCGKTTILEALSAFSHIEPNLKELNGLNNIIIQLTDQNILNLKDNERLPEINHSVEIKNNELIFSYNYKKQLDQRIRICYSTNDNKFPDIHYMRLKSNEIKNLFRIIYITTEINFIPRPITSVTAKDIDKRETFSYKTSSELATEITQLLIDIDRLDKNDVCQEGEKNENAAYKDIKSKIPLRIERFKNAFSYMFSNKQFKGIENYNNQLKVVFKEFGKDIFIDDFSSGEQQIVFRGGFILQYQKVIDEMPILIDEPEISMHPYWQEKILDFYKKLVTYENGNQKCQLFIATHSPFILHNCNEITDKVIVLTKNIQNGKIEIYKNAKYPICESEESIEKAFNIRLFSYEIKNINKPIICLEGETDKNYILNAAKLLNKNKLLELIELKPLGGEGALKKIWSEKDIFNSLLKHNLLVLHDCDSDIQDKNEAKIIIKKLPKISGGLDKGIENLFPETTIEKLKKNNNKCVKAETKITECGEERDESVIHFINKDEKRNVCDYLCQHGTKEDFQHFNIIFDIIEDFINTNTED